MAEYALQSTVLAAGTLKINLITDLAGLTIPTYPSLSPTGEFTQRVDILPGVMELDQAEFEYFEDYSVYPEGFWFKVLMYGGVQIRCTLDDTGTGDACFFFGVIPGQQAKNDELAMFGADYFVRQGRFVAVNIMTLMRETKTVDVEVPLRTHPTQITVATLNGVSAFPHASYIKVRAVFEQAVATAFGQAVDPGNVGITEDDIQFTPDETNWYGFNDLYIEGWNDATVWNGPMDAEEWPKRLPYVFDILSAISRGLGLVMRHEYSEFDAWHTLMLMSRGRSYTSGVTLPNPTSSILTASAESELRYFQFGFGDRSDRWYSDFQGSEVATEPSGWKPDYTLTAEMDANLVGGSRLNVYVYDAVNDDMKSCISTRYWDYLAGAWSDSILYRHSISAWYAARYGGGKRVYEREYATIKNSDAGGTTNNLILCQRHAITDGVAARNFYATEIRKNVLENSCYIRWQEV